MVFFDVDDDRKHHLVKHLFKQGVKILDYEDGFRFVAHNDLSQKDIRQAINLVKEYFQ